MTGLYAEGLLIYVFGKDYYSSHIIQRFSASGSTLTVYMDDFPGLGTAYDTAWRDGGVWVARDNADSPILAYDSDGNLLESVEGSVISAAMGLTLDSDGYLWAFNPDDDTIYQIEVSTTGIEGGIAPQPGTISVSSNPFQSTAVISGEGFSDATIQIFDVTGRRVVSDDFSGSFTWNAADVPSGAYFAIVSDGVSTSTAKLTRIF